MTEEETTRFINVLCRAVFLVAAADGHISDSEKDGLIRLLSRDHDLDVDREDLDSVFSDPMEHFGHDQTQCLQQIRTLSEGLAPSLLSSVIEICNEVAKVDNGIDYEEQLVISKIQDAVYGMGPQEDANKTKGFNSSKPADIGKNSMDIEWLNLKGHVDRDGNAKVIGFVQNNTDRNLDLEIEVTFYDGDEFLGHESTWVEVGPGRKRPFEITEWDCQMTRFEVEAIER